MARARRPAARRRGHARRPARCDRAGAAAQDAVRPRPLHQPAALPRRRGGHRHGRHPRKHRGPVRGRGRGAAQGHAPRGGHAGLGQHPHGRRTVPVLRLRARSPAQPQAPHPGAQDQRAHVRRRPVGPGVRRRRRRAPRPRRRGVGGDRLRRVRQPQPGAHRSVDVRARARLGARHRRPGEGQPSRRRAVGGDDARLPGRGRRRCPHPQGLRRPVGAHRIYPRDRRRDRGSGLTHITRGLSTMPITPTEKIWFNGELIPWDDAKIHILTHSLHYGMGVFEGIRAYETDDGPGVFRLTDHMRRFQQSAQILMMELPYSVDEMVQAVKDTGRSTGLPSCYIRPIAYYGYGEMGLNTLPCSIDVAVACWPWGAYLGDEALTKGVRMKISSWARHDHNIMPPAAKTTGNYVNSSLAKVEALKAGYDEAILLNRAGFVAECTGENIFVARHGRLVSPPLSAGALEGITQDTVMTLARDFGFEVALGDLSRSDLYIADEMFVCGTAAEVSSVTSVDDRPIPGPGPMTTAIGEEYHRVVRGQVDQYKDWVEHCG